MAKSKEPFNPFYTVLLVTGIVFALTACAYGVMAFKALGGAPLVEGASSGGGLLDVLDRHGGLVLTIELVVLGFATAGVIGWDQWTSSRADAERLANERPPADESAQVTANHRSGDTP